jgi:hypothetical protein
MGYAIQMFVNQASGPPKVIETKIERGRIVTPAIPIRSATNLANSLADFRSLFIRPPRASKTKQVVI